MPFCVPKYRLCSHRPFLSLVPTSLPLLRGSCPAGCASGSLTLLRKGRRSCREPEHLEARERDGSASGFVNSSFIHSLSHSFPRAFTHSASIC